VSWFRSISFIIVSSSPICCLIVTFLILSFLDILEDLLRASSSVALLRFYGAGKRCLSKHVAIAEL